MISVPWQWGQCRTCIIMLSLGWLEGCSASHTPRENSRPTPLKHPQTDQLGREVGEPIELPFRPAVLQNEVLAFDIAERAHPLQEGLHKWVSSWGSTKSRKRTD